MSMVPYSCRCCDGGSHRRWEALRMKRKVSSSISCWLLAIQHLGVFQGIW